MRNLRTNTRTYTEPIKILSRTQQVVNGVVSEELEVEQEAYGDVMVDKNNNKNQVDAISNGQTISILIHNVDIDIQPELTYIEVRNTKYVVKSVDKFGINTEEIKITANEVS